jgi:hypothetical protein
MSEPAGGSVAKGSSIHDGHANGFVATVPEKCWSRPDHYRGDMYRLFIVVSEDGTASTSRGWFTPPAKTTHAKHIRKTTPTRPSWRFKNEPIPAGATRDAEPCVRRGPLRTNPNRRENTQEQMLSGPD